VAVHPLEPGTIYLSCLERSTSSEDPRGGLWKTADGGETWRRLTDEAAQAVVLDPRRPDRVYACTWYDGLHMSEDGGATWRKSSFPHCHVENVAFDPAAPDDIVVSAWGCNAWRGRPVGAGTTGKSR
jgi:photosystem II stability/assembly factor-like uncharacterized protein